MSSTTNNDQRERGIVSFEEVAPSHNSLLFKLEC